MVSLALPSGYGAALVACAVLGCAVVVLVVAVSRSRRHAAEQARLDAELARARAEVEALAERVEALAREAGEARRAEAERAGEAAGRGYVITSLASDDDPVTGERPSRAVPALHLREGVGEQRLRPTVGAVVEARLVRSLARAADGSMVRGRAVDLAVRSVALGHGLRRALSADVLDRAAAEAHVARRRSRRDRRRELREARRLLRDVREAPVVRDVREAPEVREVREVPEVPRGDEDAARRGEDAA